MNFYQTRWAVFSLVAIWLLARLYAASEQDLSLRWETVNARKLDEYGFRARAGATLVTPWMTGHLAHPEDHNLVDHPYPAVWMFVPLYRLGGTAACAAALLAMRLAGMLLLWEVLRRTFQPGAAWWAMLLYCLAPLGTVFDGDTNAVATGALLWPLALWLAPRAVTSRGAAWALGITVFVSAQLGWMSHLLGPALLLLAWPPSGTWRALWRAPGPRAVIIGGTLTLATFIAQIIAYSPNLAENIRYVLTQAGMAPSGVGRTRMLAVGVLRCALFVGPALLLPALATSWRVLRGQERRPLPVAMTVFLPGFVLFVLVLTRFCFIERSPWSFLLIPCAILTAAAFEQWQKSWCRLALLAPSLACMGYLWIATSIPEQSNATRGLSQAMAAHTSASDFILTNLAPLQPPFEAWDPGSLGSIAINADRIVMHSIRTSADAEAAERNGGRNYRTAVLCVADPAPPVAADWIDTLRSDGRLIASTEVTIAADPPVLAMRLREAVWRLSGRFQDRGTGHSSAPQRVKLEFYRLK